MTTMRKVIQWSSGNVGKGVLRSIIERTDMSLVGLYVYDSTKVGHDAGDIAKIDKTQVLATNDVAELLALDADVLVHTPLPSLVYGEDLDADIDTFCQFLRAGVNVITTVGYMYPSVHGEELVKKLEDACHAGSATFHSTGLNPGWLGDVLPLIMSGLSRRIEQVYVREITNFEFYPSPEIMFGMMGFGKTDEAFERDVARYKHWLTGLFRENIQMIADGLGIELDSISDQTTRAYAPSDLVVAAGTVEKDTVAGQHWEWAGIKDGRKVIVHETVWRMHKTIAPDWPIGDHSVEVKGQPNMRLNFDARWLDDGLLATGMHALNAVPYVCEASSGIKTLLDLPMIIGKGLFR